MAEDKPKDGNWTFNAIQFGKADRERIAKMERTHEELLQVVRQLTFAGYKCSISWRGDLDCYMFSISGSRVTGADKGNTFTLYHSDFERLLLGVAYAFEQAAQADSFHRLYGKTQTNDW